jgi:hypothetical protein
MAFCRPKLNPLLASSRLIKLLWRPVVLADIHNSDVDAEDLTGVP